MESVVEPTQTRQAMLEIAAEDRERHTPAFFIGLSTAIALISAFTVSYTHLTLPTILLV